jgi:hypothetical protein
MEDGAEVEPKLEIWSDKGILISGGGFRDNTRVELTVIAPCSSSAMRLIDIPTTSPGTVFWSVGVPYNLLLLLSIESHRGGSIREYDIVYGEEKVSGEKTKENSSDIRATGGNCELIGK